MGEPRSSWSPSTGRCAADGGAAGVTASSRRRSQRWRLKTEAALATCSGGRDRDARTRYDSGMTRTVKLAISLPSEQVAAARQAVSEGRSASVSAYVSQALAQREREESLADVLADLARELGPPSAEAYAWADSVLAADPTPTASWPREDQRSCRPASWRRRGEAHAKCGSHVSSTLAGRRSSYSMANVLVPLDCFARRPGRTMSSTHPSR